MKRQLLQLLLAGLMLVTVNAAFGQGTTTSSINGRVTDASGETLPGATIVAVHTPSGSRYGNITNSDGYYRIPNMRVGGPYTVTVTFVGYREFKKENVYLTLGQAFKIDAQLSETSVALEAVEVVGEKSDIFDGNRTGAETVVGLEQINATPTVARAIGDFARFTPQATIDEGNDGFSISIGGQNNRYNSIYIDGAVNNDVFGLAGSGTNGGQTGVSPISIDAIEQFQIQVAPFDVRVSGFAGGAINAVTRSGSNEIEGSVYRFWRNENLAGKTPRDTDGARERLADFSAETIGFRVGGPIIKDKLFLFVNVENQSDETPQPFDFNDYEGDATAADINALRTKLQGFGYEPGTLTPNPVILDSDKITAKLDFNLNQNNKISARYSYVKADNIEAVRSTNRTLNFYNRSEAFLSKTNSLSAEWSSTIGSNASNKLTFGYVSVNDDRDPTGTDFPTVIINDGVGRINFGAEPFSTANLLDQTVFTINDNFELYKGRHTYTFGVNAEFYSVENLFIAFNYGEYEYDDLNQFLTDQPASDYFRLYSNRDNLTGDGSIAAAIFNSSLFGLYAQDEMQVNNDLKITFGLRVDMQAFDDTPENADFNNNSIPLYEAAGYDLKGARIGQFIKTQPLLSPRFGFNWDVNGDRTLQVRGGAGVFTSRIPLVWPGGAYNNNGFNTGAAFIGTDGFDGIFRPDINNQPGTFDPTRQSGNIDLFAEDFKIPQVAKINAAVDKRLNNGWIWSVDALYTKTIHAVRYENINIRPSTSNLTGTGDNRPIYNRRDEVDDTYSRVILASNTGRGYAYNLSTTLTMPLNNGLQGSVSYSYGESFNVFDGTSSQNSSQWRGLHSIGGRNFDQPLVKSFFSPGHRIIAQASYRKEWNANLATQIGLVYEGRSGRPFSYIYNDGDRLTNEASRERSLIYVPENSSDIILVDDARAGTAAEQWTALSTFINSDDYLSERRGQYAEVNQNRSPFTHVFDLRLIQDFSINAGGKKHTLQFTADIYNFGNLLNADWGRRYFVPSDFELLNFEGFLPDGTTPTYTFDGVTDNDPSANRIDDSGLTSSRWQMQLGLRYTFGN
ncbi:carboxypeptidase regulatory-like domain-containing protein [Roseivirga sp. E12]|uniref:TonB-dependent receptor n=1 Tax=Roseivirga sp. E12 TaxID=2819237 RepID=UPI001ABC07D2|nr:carboxypeptidase regulatory-like domain-containing protein [Roseivirga sp. E12]MBO3699416.1 TonB-dependent receptor [Roseivirga sp. E12]